MKRIVLAFLLVACATTGTHGPRVYVQVESHSWDATRLRVYCAGRGSAPLATIRGIETGTTILKGVRPQNCTSFLFVAESIREQYPLLNYIVSAGPGDRICVVLENAIHLSRAWNCTGLEQRGLDADTSSRIRE